MLSSSNAAQALFNDEKNLILTENGAVISTKALTFAQKNLTFSAKASKVALQTLATAGNILVSFGIAAAIQGIITGISKLSNASSNIAEKAKQIGEAYKSTQSEISDYKDKIEELHKTINNSSSSIEEVTTARQSLMTIQGEMIEKYGSEKEVIDMVTDAVNNQADAFERISEKKYQESVNDFNKFDPWENIANFFSGYSDNMDRMVSEMEEPVILNLTSAANRNKKEYEKFEKIISQYGKIGTGKYNGNGIDFFNIELSGGLDSVYEKLLKIQKAASGFDFGSNDFNKSLTNVINETKEKLDKYSDIYDNYILHEKILSKSGMKNGYDKSFENINNAMKQYTDAKLDGDEEKIRQAGEEYARILSEELGNVSPDDENVKNYLQNLYPEMQEIVGGWNLQYDLQTNSGNEKHLKDALGKFSGTNEIKEYDSSHSNDSDKNEAYAYLEGYAEKYNLTPDQLIDKLQELGLVQDEIYNALVQKFGEENIKKLTPEELEFAYTIKNTGNMSFDEFRKAIQTAKEEAEKAKLVSFDEAWNSLDTTDDEPLQNLKENLLTLAKQGKLTVEEFNKTTGAKSWLDQIGISAKEAIDKINNLKEVSSADQLASMKTGISSITNILGERKTTNTGIGADTLGSMPEDIKSCTKEYETFCEILGNSSSTMAECRKAANKLAAAYINSNNFLSQLTDSNKYYYISQLQAMGIENADIIITDILNQKKAELNAEKQWAEITTLSLANATYDEITALASEQQWSDEAKNALYRLALQKQTLNGISLNSVSDIDNLIALVDAVGGTSTALSALRKLMENPSSVSAKEMEEAQRKAKEEIEAARNKAAIASTNAPKIPENPTNDTPSPNKNKKDNPQKIKESTQIIDWIARKLDVLQNKIDLTKAKFENLFSIKKQKSNLTTQIKQTTKLLDVQEKAIKKYQKKARSIKLSRSLKTKVKNGDITGNISTLIKEYGESTASKITAYQDYIDKIRNLKKEAQETKTAIRELKEERNQLYVDRADSKLSMLDAKAENARDAKGNRTTDAVNKILKKKVKWTKEYYNYQIKNAKLEKDSVKADELRAQKKKALLDIEIEKNQNRADSAEAKYNLKQQREANATDAKTKNKHEAASLKYLKLQYDHLIKIAELEGDTTEQKRLQLEKQEKINESYKKMYDNIKSEYDNQTGLNDAQISTIQARIATLEAAGKSATKEMYNDMMKISSDTTEKLLKERAELEEAGKNFKYGSNEWYEWQNNLLAIDQQLESCTQQVIDCQKAVNALDLKKFSLIAAQLDSSNNQIDFLTSMLSHKDLTSKDAAGLTDEGFTTISLWMDKMENNRKIKENAQNALAEYMKQVSEGTTGDDFETQNQKIQEYTETIQGAILADEELKDSIIDLIEEAFNVQLDVLNELIEKRKEALRNEKDLYDYQRKVASQTKTIASIQKQIAALSGDKSEETQAKLQKLKISLEEAQDDLKETEYDKWLSDQEDMLDDLAEEMENFFENMMHDTDSLIVAVTKAISENGNLIVSTLENVGLGDSHSFDTKDNGDGTSTTNYTGYDGNNYAITHDDYGNTTSASSSNISTGSSGNSETQKSPEEIARFILDSMEKVSANTPMTGGDYINQYLSKEFDMALSGDNLKKLLEMLNVPENATQLQAMSKLVPTGIFDMLSGLMFTNKGTYSEFMEAAKQVHILRMQITGSLNKRKSLENQSTAFINKYTYGEYGNELNQYLAGKDGKVYTSWDDMKELADILGIKISGKKVTAKEAAKIRDALKASGFAAGGVVSALNEAVIQNGDDGLATLRRGESILTPEQTEQFRKFLGIIHSVNNMAEKMTKLPQSPEINSTLAKSQHVNVGGVTIHLDGSGIVDEQSFVDTFKHSTMIQSAIDESVAKGMTKTYSNTFGRF